MKSAEFGAYIKKVREAKGIPQRIVAHQLDIDTSTLSKIELGDRQFTIEMVKGLAEVLEIDFSELQIKFITDKILYDYSNQPFFKEAIIKLSHEVK